VFIVSRYTLGPDDGRARVASIPRNRDTKPRNLVAARPVASLSLSLSLSFFHRRCDRRASREDDKRGFLVRRNRRAGRKTGQRRRCIAGSDECASNVRTMLDLEVCTLKRLEYQHLREAIRFERTRDQLADGNAR